MGTITTPIRIIVADDHELIRDGFHTMLKKEEDIELVGEATDGIELIELVEKLKPDVIITDIKMPRMDGIQAVREIVKRFPDTGIIALTLYDEDNLIVDMLEAGARGYLAKTSSKEDLLEAIYSVHKKHSYYCNHTNARVLSLIAKNIYNPNKKPKPPEFNDRELEIIRLICAEKTSKEIATIMGLSKRTVEGYRDKIQAKMEVKNLAGIVVYAVRKGLFDPHQLKRDS